MLGQCEKEDLNVEFQILSRLICVRYWDMLSLIHNMVRTE
jgi:hypothetical protein